MNKSTWIKSVICMLLCVNILSLLIPAAQAESEQADDLLQTEQYKQLVISTAEEFLEFAENCRLDSYSRELSVTMANDIDLSGMQFDGIPIFCGVFDGAGYELSGVDILRSGSVQGFVRYLQAGAVIRNLTVSGNISPGGSHSKVGGIAGVNAGSIENCSFSGNVTGSDIIGGIAGTNIITGIIDGCSVSGTIHGDHFVGGIVGENLGVVRGCTGSSAVNTTVEQAAVDISDITIDTLTSSEMAVVTTDIGGIAGSNSGVIRDCTNTGDVGYRHIGYNIGGIAGSQSGYITDCSNTGEINGRKEVGGIVGQMEPSTVMRYQADTMQILEGQLGVLAYVVDGAVLNLQGSTGQLASGVQELQQVIETSQEALDELIPDSETEELPDPDTILAALNDLSSSLSSISGIVENIEDAAAETVFNLSDSLEAISEQTDIIMQTMGSAAENFGGSIFDASDADTEEDLGGKVSDCTNSGSVLGDINVGGITGAMALENDLDPESDVQIVGDQSSNYSCELRIVALRCENYGMVTAKRQNAGGIVGWMAFGLVRDCLNTGFLDASAAKYVGGIAGQSSGYIRSSCAKAQLYGSAYVGGIAGTASVVSDCRTMITLKESVEKSGAILGYAEIDPTSEEQLISLNYYFAVENDIGGIDGISYDSVAQSMSREEFFALDDIPREFRIVTVRFIFEDGIERVSTVPQGSALGVQHIPLVPEKQGYIGRWAGLDEVDIGNISFDAVFTLEYVHYDTTIMSDAVRDSGLPVLLAQGEFITGDRLTVKSVSLAPAVAGGVVHLESWEFTVPPCDSDVKLRYLVPETESGGDLVLMVRSANGQWSQADYSVDGSYIVFAVEEGSNTFALVQNPVDHTLHYIIAGGAGLLVIALIVTVIAVKKRRKLSAQTVSTEE